MTQALCSQLGDRTRLGQETLLQNTSVLRTEQSFITEEKLRRVWIRGCPSFPPPALASQVLPVAPEVHPSRCRTPAAWWDFAGRKPPGGAGAAHGWAGLSPGYRVSTCILHCCLRSPVSGCGPPPRGPMLPRLPLTSRRPLLLRSSDPLCPENLNPHGTPIGPRCPPAQGAAVGSMVGRRTSVPRLGHRPCLRPGDPEFSMLRPSLHCPRASVTTRVSPGC